MTTKDDTDQLANLMSYTVFHIGAYISLGAAVIAGGVIKKLDHGSLRLSLGCMLVAGICGGTIASEIPRFSNWDDFAKARIGPWERPIATYVTWGRIEHIAFWIGVITPAVVYLFRGIQAFA